MDGEAAMPTERTRYSGVTVAENAVKPAMSAKMIVTLACSRTSSRRRPLPSRSLSGSFRSSTMLVRRACGPRTASRAARAGSVVRACSPPKRNRWLAVPARQDRVQDHLGPLACHHQGHLVVMQNARCACVCRCARAPRRPSRGTGHGDSEARLGAIPAPKSPERARPYHARKSCESRAR